MHTRAFFTAPRIAAGYIRLFQTGGRATRESGTGWAKSLRSAVLRVPCALVPKAFNYLVNPLHPDSAKIRVSAPEPLRFDTRLKMGIRRLESAHDLDVQ